MKKLQLWLTMTERDTLETALRFYWHANTDVRNESYTYKVRAECARTATSLTQRRLDELIARLAVPSPAAHRTAPPGALGSIDKED